MKPKIFVYRPTDRSEDCGGVAYDENGGTVASHVSSSLGWFRLDMGLRAGGLGVWRRKLYVDLYPEGYELVEVIGRQALERHIEAGDIRNLSFDKPYPG